MSPFYTQDVLFVFASVGLVLRQTSERFQPAFNKSNNLLSGFDVCFSVHRSISVEKKTN
jgi:hypothetical protein